ncbi:MAG: DUF3822 family protein [Bacteroidia bacterium]
MNRTPFEQITHIPQDIRDSLIATCHLVVFVQTSRIYYLLLSPSGEVVLCRECINSDGFSQEMFLRFVLEKDKLLSEPFLNCRIYISSPLFTFVPDKWWDAGKKGLLARATLSDQLEDGEIITCESKTLRASLLYSLRPGIPHLLDRYIRHYSLSHIGLLMAETTIQACADHAMISVLVMDDYVLISAVKKKQLLLCNSYQYRSASDMVYFIQTVKEVTGLMQSNIPVCIMGELGEKITREGGIWEYLTDINIPGPESPFFVSETAGTQWWKFSFLANIDGML